MPSVSLGHGSFVGEAASAIESTECIAGHWVDRPAHPVSTHTHETAHFCIVTRGRYSTNATGVGEICDGTAVLYHPAGTTHADHFVSPGGSFLTVALSEKLVDQLPGAGLPERSTATLDPQARLVAHRLEDELLYRGPLAPQAVASLVIELLALSVPALRQRGSAPSWLKTAVEYLRESHAGLGTVGNVAAQVGVHPVTLTKGFRAYLGTTPSCFLQGCRLTRARVMLAEDPHRSISEIALQAGYSDQPQFTREFKKAFGEPPGRWRRTRAELS